MEEARRVLERLERIDAMRRATAGPTELLEELRCLLHEAEAWVALEGGDRGQLALERLRASLEREAIVA